jgi:RimJ/RimL family protein N-acetyltransferase
MPEHPPRRIEVHDDLILRWADLDDAELIASAVGESLEHLRPWMSWATADAADLEEQRKRRVEMSEQAAAGTDYMYLVLAGEGGSLLGVCGLHRRIGPGAMEIGYWLHPAHVGHGYITSAAAALTQAALALDDVERVELHCDEANVRSQAVASRLGFRLDRIELDGIQAPAEAGRSMIWIYPPSTS